MKLLLFAGLALAFSVPAWSQPQQPPPPPPAPDDRSAPGGPPQVGGPIQLQNPHRRGDGGPIMGGGQGGGIMSFGEGANTVPFLPGNGYYGGNPAFNTPPSFPPAPPVSMFADERYLFILRGDTLMQFDKKNLTLLKSVELPRSVIIAPSADGQVRARTSPPLLKRPN